jgi:hypothetical protein
MRAQECGFHTVLQVNWLNLAQILLQERVVDFCRALHDNEGVVHPPRPVLLFHPVPESLIAMTKKIAATPKALAPAVVAAETEQDRFTRILTRAQFKPLKDVLDKLGLEATALIAAIITTNAYPMFLAKAGYRMEIVKQIHEQDCYSRLGPAGGIRAVLPLHDTATYSTMVTLVNYNLTVTTTANSVEFYDEMLAEFKTQLMNRAGNPA